jgi:hypothetical protein
MKYLKFALFSFLLIYFACKKDVVSDNNPSLIATWNLVDASSLGWSEYRIGPNIGNVIVYKTTGTNFATTVTFKDDSTYSSAGSYTAAFSQTFLDVTLKKDSSFTNFAGSGKWKLNGTVLNLTDLNGTINSAQILELTSNKLRYSITFKNIDTTSWGENIISNNTYTYTLMK